MPQVTEQLEISKEVATGYLGQLKVIKAFISGDPCKEELDLARAISAISKQSASNFQSKYGTFAGELVFEPFMLNFQIFGSAKFIKDKEQLLNSSLEAIRLWPTTGVKGGKSAEVYLQPGLHLIRKVEVKEGVLTISWKNSGKYHAHRGMENFSREVILRAEQFPQTLGELSKLIKDTIEACEEEFSTKLTMSDRTKYAQLLAMVQKAGLTQDDMDTFCELHDRYRRR